MMFIRLLHRKDDPADKPPIFLNAAHISAMHRMRFTDPKMADYTFVTVTSGSYFTVYETPDEIVRIIERAEIVGAVEAGR
jgi:hypothetical protein